MQTRKAFVIYCVAYVTVLASMGMLLALYPKLELHLLLNSHHTHLQDVFFTYYSMVAEGPIYALALLPLLWKKLKLTVFFGLCELTGGSILQLLKHTICMPRPISAFEGHADMVLPVVQGVSLNHGNSFPSGHASTFFVFFTCCALLLAYRYRQRTEQGQCCYMTRVTLCAAPLLLLFMAALGAYSRVYLSQHFLSDVCMGSLIGFLTTCILFHFARRKLLG